MSAEPEVTPRLAATTILVRARGTQPELLLLKRGEHARFMPNAYVFAGGALDCKDESADVYALCEGLDDARASEKLALSFNGVATDVIYTVQATNDPSSAPCPSGPP